MASAIGAMFIRNTAPFWFTNIVTEKVSGPSSRLAAAPSDVASSVLGMPYKAIGGLIGTLMEQNAQAFNQI
ncbi:uncharacterized protein DS421_16g555320 [Arachis hypogaea]|nr:uncharacterized protein DS421_16g555320 [Arachis hypogaea]